jgi:hypothetical protein
MFDSVWCLLADVFSPKLRNTANGLPYNGSIAKT